MEGIPHLIIQMLQNYTHANVEIFNISGNVLGDEGIKVLTHALQCKSPGVSKVLCNVRSFDISRTGASNINRDITKRVALPQLERIISRENQMRKLESTVLNIALEKQKPILFDVEGNDITEDTSEVRDSTVKIFWRCWAECIKSLTRATLKPLVS